MDGKQHNSTKEAAHHLEELFGAIITKHAHKLCQLNKYAETLEYLEANYKDFVKAAQYRDDILLTEED